MHILLITIEHPLTTAASIIAANVNIFPVLMPNLRPCPRIKNVYKTEILYTLYNIYLICDTVIFSQTLQYLFGVKQFMCSSFKQSVLVKFPYNRVLIRAFDNRALVSLVHSL